jgi:hypothetical protein
VAKSGRKKLCITHTVSRQSGGSALFDFGPRRVSRAGINNSECHNITARSMLAVIRSGQI